MKLVKNIGALAKAKLEHLLQRLLSWDARYKWGKYALAFLIVGGYTCGRGDYTLRRYIELKQRQYKVADELDELIPRFLSDSLRLENIRTNPEEVEYIAREKYLMKSPGEEIYIFKPSPDGKTH